jgi:hypothetical protein
VESYAPIAVSVAFIVGVTIFMVTREKELARDRRLKLVAFALFAISAVFTGWVDYSIVLAPDAIAEGDINVAAKGGGTVDFDVPSGAVQLRVDGETGDPVTRSGGRGGYEIEVREAGADGKVLQRVSGNIDHHVETQTFMKRGKKTVAVDVASRQDLQSDLAGKKVTLALTREDGALRGPVHVRAIPAPPKDELVLAVGAVLALIGAVLDRRMKDGSKSYVAVGVAFYFAFAELMMRQNQPIEIPKLAGVALISLLCGAAVGGVFRIIVRPFVKPLPGSVPASGR